MDILRITNNMLSNNLLQNLESAQGRMDKLQNQLSSRYKISRPSDDPAGVETALRLKSSISYVEKWKANAGEGKDFMDTVDTTLGDMTLMLQRAKDIAEQGANGTNTKEDREKLAKEVDQIREQLIETANTKFGSKYVFGGTINEKPFPKGATDWKGSDDSVAYQVGSNLSIEVSVSGVKLFGVSGTSVPPNTNVGLFNTLTDLSTNLRNTDPDADGDGIRDLDKSMDQIEAQLDNVVNYRAELGARYNRMESVYNQLDATSLNLTGSFSSIMDTDMAKTLIDFQSQKNVYQAALSVGANIIQPSLVDYIK